MKRCNMNKIKKAIIMALLVILTAVQIQYFALADSRTELIVTTDVLEMYPGNTFTVTITFTSKDEDISAVQASIEYDADIIEYRLGGNAIGLSAGTGGISDDIPPGTKTKSYEIRFSGRAKIAVTQSQVLGHDSGSVLGEPVADIVVTVSNPTTQTSDEEPKETPSSSEQPTDNIWLKSSFDGDLIYISKDLSEITLPHGFSIEDTIYEGEQIQAARDLDRDLTLIYIRKRGFSSFYIYNQHEQLYPYAELHVEAIYTILECQEKLSNCVETNLLLNDKLIKAWVSDMYGEDFYIVYAMNSRGSKGFYLYDSMEGSMQRMIVDKNIANTIDMGEEN